MPRLLGVLAVRDAAAQPQRAKAFLGAAADAFREALRLDPDNEQAAADLELLLTQSAARRQTAASGNSKRGAQKARSNRHGHGAGASKPHGLGY